MVKRYFRANKEARNIRIVKAVSIVALLALFFSLLAYLYIDRFSSSSACLKPLSEEAVLKITANGGYSSLPTDAVAYNSYIVPLYMKEGAEFMPSLEDVQASLLSYVREKNKLCDDDIKVRFGRHDVKIGRAFEHAVVPVALEEDYDKAVQLYEAQKNISAISLAELARLAKQGNYVLHINANNNTILYFMTFTNEVVDGKPLVFAFGIKK